MMSLVPGIANHFLLQKELICCKFHLESRNVTRYDFKVNGLFDSMFDPWKGPNQKTHEKERE